MQWRRLRSRPLLLLDLRRLTPAPPLSTSTSSSSRAVKVLKVCGCLLLQLFLHDQQQHRSSASCLAQRRVPRRPFISQTLQISASLVRGRRPSWQELSAQKTWHLNRIPHWCNKATPLRSQSEESSTQKVWVPRPPWPRPPWPRPTLLPHWPNLHRGLHPSRRERSRWPSGRTEKPTQSWHVSTVNYSNS